MHRYHGNVVLFGESWLSYVLLLHSRFEKIDIVLQLNCLLNQFREKDFHLSWFLEKLLHRQIQKYFIWFGHIENALVRYVIFKAV